MCERVCIVSKNFEVSSSGLGIDTTKYVYVESERFDDEDYKPPATWCVRDAMGNYMYFKARGRASAQALCDEYYGKGKYTVRNDRPVQGR